jgi:hypothetical protein
MDSIFELENYVNDLRKEDDESLDYFIKFFHYSEVGTMKIVPLGNSLFLNNFGKKCNNFSAIFNRFNTYKIWIK